MLDDPVLIDDWHPIARDVDVVAGKPVGVHLLGEDLVLWRPNGGGVLAWQDLCVHRGTRLSLGRIDGATLECPYHGWTYDRTGHCVRIPAHPDQAPPARAAVKTYQATVRYGLIWVSLGTPGVEPPPFPEWHDPSYRKILCGPYTVAASGPRIVENFLDVGHFPFVHEGVLGTRERPRIEEYAAEIGREGVVARGVRVFQPDPYGTGVGDLVSYTYRVFRPLTAYLAKESDGPRFSILLLIAPHAVVRSTVWMWMAMNYGHDLAEAELVAWQDGIFEQDRPILESQRPERLPLDLQAELHLRSDRAAIAYRRWLGDLGLTFGTA
ncbi:MAG: aromatic ring-hydroxylating dioxygenase subunit alpha [Chloroflexi bacterium]|nr:aromatic ring-hydroxylating dioxygenase subunit alpha [Chloroflexota bacterium]